MAEFFKPKAGYESAKFVHISTDEVYGSLGPEGLFDENSPYLPNSPYSASKASSDLFVRSYFHTYGLNVVMTHCSNNYGSKQHTEKLIPKMITNIIDNKPLTIHGKGNNSRDWLYVIDHCVAIHAVLLDAKPGETFNIGANNEWSNVDIIHYICDLMDKVLGRTERDSARNTIVYVTDRPGNDMRYAIDSSKLETTLNWKRQFDFETCMKKTVMSYLD